MNRKHFSILSGLVVLALVSLACAFTLPGAGEVDSLATSVAATVNALAGMPEEVPHDPATDLPPDEAETSSPLLGGEAPLRVSFVTPDGNLYTWADGDVLPTLLLASGDISSSTISPDGTLVAFSRYSGYTFVALEVIGFDGSDRRSLLTAEQAALLPRPDGAVDSEPDQLAWIPGTHSLSMSLRHSFEGPGLFRGEEFYIADADAAGFFSLMETGNTTWQFVWSPDGSKVAISNPTGLEIYNAAGAKIAGPVLTHPFINTASEYAWTSYPIWSQDGESLLVRVPPQDPWSGTGPESNSNLWRVAADGLSGELIFSTLMQYNIRGDTGVSPNLEKILYLVRTGLPTENIYNLVVSNVDGSDSVVYATGYFMNTLAWSTDGLRFFYSLGDMPASQPYIGAPGMPPELVADFANPMDLRWVDANRYLVTTNEGGRRRLLLGSVGAPTGLIYDSLTPYDDQITFSVNR